MIKIVEIKLQGGFAPYQCLGVTDDNREVFARHRGGEFYVSISEPGEKTKLWKSKILIFEYRPDCDYETLRQLTAGIIEWPDNPPMILPRHRIVTVGASLHSNP